MRSGIGRARPIHLLIDRGIRPSANRIDAMLKSDWHGVRLIVLVHDRVVPGGRPDHASAR